MTDLMRLTGLSSGLDTETVIDQLTQSYQVKIDQYEQDKQYTEWQIDAYRDIINQVKNFKETYFDFLTPESNLRSSSAFNSYAVSYDGESSSDYISVTPDVSASAGSYTISNVTVASKARVNSSSMITDSIVGESITTPISIDSTSDNNQFYLTFNGSKETITISDGTYNTVADLQSEIQTQVDSAVGSGKITINLTGGSSDQLEFSTENTNTLFLSTVSGNIGLETIGFTDSVNKSNKIELNESLSDISTNFAITDLTTGSGNDIEFTINDVNFSYDSSETTLQDIITEVSSNSDAGVNMRYDELNDKIVVESDQTGVTAQVDIADVTGNLMTVLGLNGQNATGTDASMDFDDGSGTQTITRSSNNFEINGLTFNLNENYTGDIDLDVNTDTSSAVDLISNFVEDYNELITTINGELNEPVYSDYQPLTDEQKSAMTETQIEQWEEKAKSGILKNDSNLENMLDSMRQAIYEEVENVGMSIYDIGITTSSNYFDRGKLILDEEQLSTALENNPQEVARLFSYDDDDNSSNENGIAERLYDIVQDNIRLTRDSSGNKGILLEKAGMEGDVTEYSNFLTNKITEYEEEIEELLGDMSDQEDYYYNMFAKMEKAMSEMQAQQSWLQAQLGGMQ